MEYQNKKEASALTLYVNLVILDVFISIALDIDWDYLKLKIRNLFYLIK